MKKVGGPETELQGEVVATPDLPSESVNSCFPHVRLGGASRGRLDDLDWR
jgi:hypothetical protein